MSARYQGTDPGAQANRDEFTHEDSFDFTALGLGLGHDD
jgi:hypothetical protein